MAFTAVWFIGLCSLLHGCGIHVEASHKIYPHLQTRTQNVTATHQPYRTGYHFQPAKYRISGPMIYKGIYHFMYQYNPRGAVWGHIVWAHATSTDLVNWVHYEPAIKPSIESDIKGCWSGSTTILPDGKPAILYTGIDPKKRQVQNLAFPKNLSDPYLREWIKVPQNPVMTPIDGINASSFRDPTTAWLAPDGQWRVIIGSKIDRLGKAILYKSKDFFKWERVDHPLHSSENTGMWECPDFYPVSVNLQGVGLDTSVIGPNVKHVMKVSLDDKKDEYYTIGTYKLEKDIYVPDEGSIDDDSGLRYDYGKFYASKTFFDSSKNRRILWGWINESDSVTDDVKKGWSGVQAIPRNIWLDKAGKQLVQWPVAEIENLRKTPVELQNTQLNGGSVLEVTGVTASQLDEAEIDTIVAENKQRGERENCICVCFFAVLLCKIDHSIVESFGGKGKVCITSRVYPELAIFDKTHLYVFNNGTENMSISKLSAWSMEKAKIIN
ncbi:hypothetical protein NE237_029994 [Protea cynaroides]|uniref:Beta-fructofuranosidase n=1 Tax=Protea cynaroides TaxID=273540 RepID=A0A9Q0JVM1_9MAGN|nr:hypothetical protein NE237_029994 [Protea cynaroides]